jgi:hypothetical protein
MTYLSNIAHSIARSEGDPKLVQSGPSSLGASDRLAKALGWFSIGLGLAEVIAPRRITRALGMQGSEALVRAYGVREIASGLLSLSTEKNVGLWSRIAGDGVDIATLLTALRQDNPKRDNVALALTMVAGVTVLDLVGAQTNTARHSRNRGQRRLYYDRNGFPKGIEAARGAAKNFQVPREMRAKPALASVGGRG